LFATDVETNKQSMVRVAPMSNAINATSYLSKQVAVRLELGQLSGRYTGNG